MKNRSTQEWIAIAAALVVVAVVFIVPLFFHPIASLSSKERLSIEEKNNIPQRLGIVDVRIGTGTPAALGDTVAIRYTGMLSDGTVFSATSDKPFVFRIGGGKVIKGLDSGIRGMRTSGKRTLTIPSSLGYGAESFGPIPANATLIFDIELVNITPATTP